MLGYCALGLALLKGVCVLYNKNENILKQEDFDSAEWIEFYNYNGRVSDCFMYENISRNPENRYFYMHEVGRKNNNNLVGKKF